MSGLPGETELLAQTAEQGRVAFPAHQESEVINEPKNNLQRARISETNDQDAQQETSGRRDIPVDAKGGPDNSSPQQASSAEESEENRLPAVLENDDSNLSGGSDISGFPSLASRQEGSDPQPVESSDKGIENGEVNTGAQSILETSNEEAESETSETVRTSAQTPAETDCAPVRNPSETEQCAPVRTVLDFPLRTGAQSPKKGKLRTGAQSPKSKSKSQKTKDLPELRTGAQSDEEEVVKTILPTPPKGWWWVVDADASGFKIKLRWREGAPPHSVVFPRLGKNEFNTLMEVSSDERKWLLADRISGDLATKDRGDIADRLGLESGNNQAALKTG